MRVETEYTIHASLDELMEIVKVCLDSTITDDMEAGDFS